MTDTLKRDDYPDYYEPGMPGYVIRDWEVIDYECYELDETELWFRGPAPEDLKEGEYFSAIGAAQTFGCFCPKPYPAMIEERLGMQALNLGYSGAGPSFFLQHPKVLEYVNQSAFCIVQVMSARSVSNSFFENPKGLAYGKRTSDGEIVSAETAYDELLSRMKARYPFEDDWLKRKVMGLFPPSSLRQFVRESRNQWLEDYRALMKEIQVPKILFWFSKRTPFYVPKYGTRRGVFRDFPQLVNLSMVRSIKRFVDHYVSCVSSRGLPQPLISRFTGEPVTVDQSDDKPLVKRSDGKPLYDRVMEKNRYYPSPQMQEDAAKALAPVCEQTLTKPVAKSLC